MKHPPSHLGPPPYGYQCNSPVVQSLFYLRALRFLSFTIDTLPIVLIIVIITGTDTAHHVTIN